ncbi:hypothetical protein LJR034_003388 [Caballeronia sp. LjRoot34]|uniref:hypothetical protein n=1 Tax=Caballeronia sp. LjRoot34 TaxID=3342325 RepID=UPI003ED11DB5
MTLPNSFNTVEIISEKVASRCGQYQRPIASVNAEPDHRAGRHPSHVLISRNNVVVLKGAFGRLFFVLTGLDRVGFDAYTEKSLHILRCEGLLFISLFGS